MTARRKDNQGKDSTQDQRMGPRPDHPGMANLTPWPKGVSGNPGGRPKSKSLLRTIREVLEEPAADLQVKKLDGKTVKRLLAEMAILNAMEGKPGYFKELMVHLHGRPVLRIEQKRTEDVGEPLSVEVAAAMIRAGMIAAGETEGPES